MALKVERIQDGALPTLLGIIPDKGSISLHEPSWEGKKVIYFEQHEPPIAQLREEGKVGPPLAQVSLPTIGQSVTLFASGKVNLQVTRI